MLCLAPLRQRTPSPARACSATCIEFPCRKLALMSLRQFSFQLRLLFIVLSIRTGRAVTLETIRSRWGRGSSRAYQFDAIASSHASRVAMSSERSLDSRTWDDLNLNEVFAAVDHTTSTLGQHALYHRLRTIRDNDTDLSEFETLATLV